MPIKELIIQLSALAVRADGSIKQRHSAPVAAIAG